MDQKSYEVIKKAVLDTLNEKGEIAAAYEANSVFELGEKAVREEAKKMEQEEQERQNAKQIEPFNQSSIAEMAAKNRIV
ncbi:hypothetical protein [Carnobacterium inhibens]|uniref:Uncharacterized protein n=1 Tax=Carnobacterium inhibens TaxID=147709 RepID=A0ABR7TFQ1_9LACT|nr:hypothetical protein [Carnobacterium inhibens]MBC9826437.1 hypothetical protein [Carnobacterium inhibens]